jgi:5-methyltetrahydropteroyltriglutamate--homocysteine methyltransferase
MQTNGILRVDQIGSLLRPAGVMNAVMASLQGTGGQDELKAKVEPAVLAVMGSLAALGMPIGNGELPRFSYLEDMTRPFEPVFDFEGGHPLPWHDDQGEAPAHIRDMKPPLVIGKLTQSGNHLADEEARFVLDHVEALGLDDPLVKFTIPSPAHHAIMGWREERTSEFYPTRVDLLRAATRVLADEARRLAEAGVDYIQVDNPALNNYDPALHAYWRERGVDLDALLPEIIASDNAILNAAKQGGAKLTGLHICLGNAMGYRLADEIHSSIAPHVFPRTVADRILLDLTDPTRSGDFELLQHIPSGKTIVLGLISTKVATLESPDIVLETLRKAATFLSSGVEMALSPQCGFASGFSGNPITIRQQWQKLGLVRHVARRMFG